MKTVDLSVIVVNYNNLRVLRDCLPSLTKALTGLRAEVILSDNGSSDDSLSWVRAQFPTVRILENGANLGFAEANNRAFAIARGHNLLLLNPDTIVTDGAVEAMITALEKDPKVGAVGCKLLNADGTRQISARSFPTLFTYAWQMTGLAHRRPANRVFGRFNIGYWDGTTERDVDWVTGAALLTRREVMERVVGFDPLFFLTYDEVDLCRRIRNAGFSVRYTPTGRIVHLDRQSEPQSNPKPEARIKYLTVERNSRVRYFVKHHGMLYAGVVEGLHIVLSAGLMFKAAALGTGRSPIAVMETRLLLKLYWQTLCRIPKVFRYRVATMLAGSETRPPVPFFINPYLADDC